MAKKKRSSQQHAFSEGPIGPITSPDRNPTPLQYHNPAVPQSQAAASRNQIGCPTNNQNVVVTGPTELVQAEHPEYPTASFFPSSSGFNVSGGQFSSYRDHHTTGNVFINVNPGSRNDDSVEIRTRSAGRMDNRVPPEEPDDHWYPRPSGLDTGYPQGTTSESTQRDYASSFSGPPEISNAAYQHNSLEQPTPGPSLTRQQGSLSPLPVQKSSEIYYRHLSILGRGSPLWIPEPSNTLPMEYQREGIGIGDVGILVDSGGFDFLFNIYQPKNDPEHPINPRTLPEGFSPLNPPEERDMSSHVEFKNNSFLASSHVNSRRDGASPGLIFESSANDGAILTMPNGANSKDLENKTIFRKYVRLNAQRWYTYANEVRGRDARNGDLRLVVGKTSTTAWGMATFANHSEQSAFRLEFKPTGDGGEFNNIGASYTWEHSGVAELKFGPDAHEVEKLRIGDQQGDCPMKYENQSLFIRTINVTLQDDVWKRLTEQWELLDLDDDEHPTSNSESNPSFLFGSSATGTSTISGAVAGASGSGSTFGNTMNLAGSLVYEDHSVSQNRRPRRSVHLSAFPPPLSFHPSKVINNFLLSQIPEAKMAITEDNDWISVLEKSDVAFPEPDVLISRIIDLYEICIEEDVLFLRVRDPDILPRRRTRSYSPFVPPLYDIEDDLNDFGMPEPEAGFSDKISTSTSLTDLRPLGGSQTKYKEKLHNMYEDGKLSASEDIVGKPSLRPINRLAITYQPRPRSNPWTKPKILTFATNVTLFEFDPKSAANSMPHKSRIHENELKFDMFIDNLALFNHHLHKTSKSAEWIYSDGGESGINGSYSDVGLPPDVILKGTKAMPVWYVKVMVDGEFYGRGVGNTKKAACNEAAREGLRKLGITRIFGSDSPSKDFGSPTSLNESTLSPPPKYSPNLLSPSLILPPPSPPKKVFEKFSEINISANQDQIQIHFLLAYTPDSTPPVHIDLSFPPPLVLQTEHLQSLSEPATSPAQPTLIIKYPSGLKNEIMVTPQRPTSGFVSVHDVLSALYQDLWKPITAHEYMDIEDRKTREDISNTYYSRCRAIKSLAERREQEQRGLRRIDLLMGKHRFLGLSATTIAANVWVINVATLSPN